MKTLFLLAVILSYASAYIILKGEAEFEKIRDSLHRLSDETRDLDTSDDRKKSLNDHIQELSNKLYKVHDAFLEKERLNDYRYHNSHTGHVVEKVGIPLKRDAPAKTVEKVGIPLHHDAPAKRIEEVGIPLSQDAPSKTVEKVGIPLHHDAPIPSYRKESNNANLLEQLDEIDEEFDEPPPVEVEEEEFSDTPPGAVEDEKKAKADSKDKITHNKKADYIPAAFRKDTPSKALIQDSGKAAFKKAIAKEVQREKANKKQHDAVKDELRRKVEDLGRIVSQLKDAVRSKFQK